MKALITFSACLSLCLSLIAQETHLLKIGLIADPQYADIPATPPRYFDQSIWKLTEAIDSFNYYQVDFVQTLGDVINDDFASFDEILPPYEALNPSVESYHLLGNHEFLIEDDQMDQLLDVLEMEDFYYSYVRENFRFVVLDATDYAYYSQPLHGYDLDSIDAYYEATSGQQNHQLWNSAIGPAQQNWLINQLDSAEILDQKVVVFSHCPLKPIGDIHNLWNNHEIIDIIESYDNIVAHLNGHDHLGSFFCDNNIVHISMYGMVNTLISSYGILELYNDQMILKGFGNQESFNINFGDCQISGIEEGKSQALFIYPNPSSGVFQLNLSGHAEIILSSLSGKTLWYQKNFTGDVLDLSHFNPGFYILTLSNQDGIRSQKIAIH